MMHSIQVNKPVYHKENYYTTWVKLLHILMLHRIAAEKYKEANH